MSNPDERWWGRCEPVAELDERRTAVAHSVAVALGVPVAQVTVVETVEAQGVQLRAVWCPS